MKKLFNCLFLLILGLTSVSIVSAANFDQEKARETVEEFVTCLNNADECALNYIVKTNEDLVAGVRENLRAVEIHYYIKDVEKVDDYYVVKMTINAEGPGWSISGFTVKYNVENVNGSALITETTLFDSII